MNPPLVTGTINLLGFAIGFALYAMLLIMVVRHKKFTVRLINSDAAPFAVDWLLLATAVLGLLWNAGELVELIRGDYLGGSVSPVLRAIAHGALGFLPAVVVHSAWTLRETRLDGKARLLTGAAYILSGSAAAWHFYTAVRFGFAPAGIALQMLTVGYTGVLLILFLLTLRQTLEQRAVWATALAVFAVSALHLSLPHDESGGWAIELITHQASLPLALAILLQDFRFAFADLFLKRALSFLLLILAAAGWHLLIAAPLVGTHRTHSPSDAQPMFILLGSYAAVALAYPYLHRIAVWLVDKVLLRRADYKQLHTEIMHKIALLEPVERVLSEVSENLTRALTANNSSVNEFFYQSDAGSPVSLVNLTTNAAEILIPTHEQPGYKIVLRDFLGGRRLLSDETEMLETIAVQTARRIDALRVTHERCEQELREQEFSKLATEAELRALRAQIDPHFLFNALTTIGYLINAAPERALATLMKLTQLLRGSLGSTSEFSTLGEELKLIESYLEIERARFEERLTVEIAVAPELLCVRIPSLLLQPLVENAVKHGIAPKKAGGTIRIAARRSPRDLIVEIADTGAGVSQSDLERRRATRVGLSNVEQRLNLHYNGGASLEFESAPGAGARVTIRINLKNLEAGAVIVAAARRPKSFGERQTDSYLNFVLFLTTAKNLWKLN